MFLSHYVFSEGFFVSVLEYYLVGFSNNCADCVGGDLIPVGLHINWNQRRSPRC